jgi:hypothetical protein
MSDNEHVIERIYFDMAFERYWKVVKEFPYNIQLRAKSFNELTGCIPLYIKGRKGYVVPQNSYKKIIKILGPHGKVILRAEIIRQFNVCNTRVQKKSSQGVA